MYSKKHQERIDKETTLGNSVDKVWNKIKLSETEIDISGKVCRVDVYRLSNGNIEISPIDEGIMEDGGWLQQGTYTEGYNNEVIISQFNY